MVDKDENTPLDLVALNDDDGKFVQALIKRGVNVNAENQDSSTPLHLAAEHGHTDIVNAIIQNRANVIVVNIKMEVPLYIWLLHVIAKKKL
ncbi:ankyrin repeat domain-containing protein [Wolbachia endosymbiont of Atemnus politus]|uniref:ankyrin repeat domain-containing protein n=1 Tax=Wolbachia endosymbiont of Atemnus politus TaxID=2682840 RepID=UPI0031B61797